MVSCLPEARVRPEVSLKACAPSTAPRRGERIAIIAVEAALEGIFAMSRMHFD